jgi:hypothetical protein
MHETKLVLSYSGRDSAHPASAVSVTTSKVYEKQSVKALAHCVKIERP